MLLLMLGQSYLNAEVMVFGRWTAHPHSVMEPQQQRIHTVQPSPFKQRTVHICRFAWFSFINDYVCSVFVCQLSKWHFWPKTKPSERGEASASAHFVIWLAIHIPSCTSNALFRVISSALKRYLGEQAGCFSILSSIQSVSTAHALWLASDACWLVGTIHSVFILLSLLSITDQWRCKNGS